MILAYMHVMMPTTWLPSAWSLLRRRFDFFDKIEQKEKKWNELNDPNPFQYFLLLFSSFSWLDDMQNFMVNKNMNREHRSCNH